LIAPAARTAARFGAVAVFGATVGITDRNRRPASDLPITRETRAHAAVAGVAL